MKKKIALTIIILSLIIVIAGCANEKNIIALQKVKYIEEEAIIHIYYFPTQYIAEEYFKNKNIEKFYLFRSPSQNAEKFFKGLDSKKNVEIVEENEKKITFTADSENTAIEKVVNFIDMNNLLKINI